MITRKENSCFTVNNGKAILEGEKVKVRLAKRIEELRDEMDMSFEELSELTHESVVFLKDIANVSLKDVEVFRLVDILDYMCDDEISNATKDK